MKRSATYRRDIDGLRAIAIVPVLLLHLDIAPFSGGFVGVDVFFVISGYLITTLLVTELDQGNLSLWRFYERRARRILPALFVVLLACVVAVAILGDIKDTAAFGKELTATLLFYSNIEFWQQSGYFAADAHSKPLLHTWSLAVEEQFYILFPLFLMAIARWGGRRFASWTAGFLLISLASSAWLVATHPSAAFYLAPSRNWELSIGVLLAVGAFAPVRSRVLRETIAGTGLAAIAVAVFAFNSQTPFPGLAALLPCVGTAALVHVMPGTLVGRLLSSTPLVFLGLISYPLYLWHWPLIVFSGWAGYAVTAPATQVAIIALSTLAAVLTWQLIERPVRSRSIANRQWQLFGGAAATTALLLAVATSATSAGWPERFSPEVQRLAQYASHANPRSDECRDRVADACVFGANVPAEFALLGDSHADAMVQAIGSAAERHQQSLKLFWMAGCLGGIPLSETDQDCNAYERAAVGEILGDPALQTVILAARYARYLDGPTPPSIGVDDASRQWVDFVDDDGAVIPRTDIVRVLTENLRQLVHRIEATGRTVVLVYPIPEAGFDVPRRLAASLARGERLPVLSYAAYVARQRDAFKALDSVDGPVLRIYPHKRLCDGETCSTVIGDEPLYSDSDHLGTAGNRYISPVFDEIFSATH